MKILSKFRVLSVDCKKIDEKLKKFEMSGQVQISQTIEAFFDNYETYWTLAEDDCPRNVDLLENLDINVGEFYQIVREKDMELMRFGQLIADAQVTIDANPESSEIPEIIKLAKIKEKALKEMIDLIDQIKIQMKESKSVSLKRSSSLLHQKLHHKSLFVTGIMCSENNQLTIIFCSTSQHIQRNPIDLII